MKHALAVLLLIPLIGCSSEPPQKQVIHVIGCQAVKGVNEWVETPDKIFYFDDLECRGRKRIQ